MDLKNNKIEFVKAYLRNFEEGTKEDFWAVKELDRLLFADKPQNAWELVLLLINAASSERQLAYLGSGPLEDLLAHHPKFLNRVEAEVIKNQKFRYALACVWRNRMSWFAWRKLQKIRRNNNIKMI